MASITLVTWNTHHGEGPDRRLDLERVARTLLHIDADVVTLQEVDVEFDSRSEWVDQAAWYRDRLGMHMTFGANVERCSDTGRRRRYGTAILSRHPIRNSRNTRLPQISPRLEPRGLLHAEIAIGGTVVGVFNTHLQSHHPPLDLAHLDRREQAREIHAVLGEYANPLLLAGDFNAEPDASELQELRRDYTDAWAAAGNGVGYTRRYRRPEQPDRRIDYVFASPGVRVVRAEVVDSDASDHAPLVVKAIVGHVEAAA